MKKISLIIFLALSAATLFCSCEKGGAEQDAPIAPGMVEVKGTLIDVRDWTAGENLYPQHNGYQISDDAAALFEEPMKYSVGLMESAGPVEVRSGNDGVVTIAADTPEMPSEYVPTDKSFEAGDIIYYLYERNVTAGKWVSLSKPADSKCSLIVFAKDINVAKAEIPGKVIAQVPELRHGTISNVSMAILPNGDYIASCTGASATARVSLFLSKDRGETWNVLENTNVNDNGIKNYYNIFIHNGALYMMGVGNDNNNILLSRSEDNGITWTVPADDKTGVLKTGPFHSAATAVVVSGGRLWRAMEAVVDGKKHPFVMSAPADGDLFDASEWKFSNNSILGEGFNHQDHEISELIEGNMVATPDGKVYNVLRASSRYTSAAAVTLLVTDIQNLATPSSTYLVTMPGGGKKFTVRYDPVSKRYWAITNPAGKAGMKHNGIYSSGITYDLVRNRMVLIYSKDLTTWVQYKEIVSDSDPFFHGFQYVDWQFDGEDIVAVCRMACPEKRGLPVRQHDANMMTFHRISNFRNL